MAKEFGFSYKEITEKIPYKELLLLYFSNREMIIEMNKEINKSYETKEKKNKVVFTKNKDGVPNFFNF